MKFCILIFMWYHLLSFALITTFSKSEYNSFIIIFYSSIFFFPYSIFFFAYSFPVVLGIHRAGKKQELGRRPLSLAGPRLPLHFSNRVAPCFTNLWLMFWASAQNSPWRSVPQNIKIWNQLLVSHNLVNHFIFVAYWVFL